MTNKSANLKGEDIIAFTDPSPKPLKPEIVKAEYVIDSIENIIYGGELASTLQRKLTQQGVSPVIDYQITNEGKREDKRQNWFKDGLICEILQMGTSIWQKGRFTIKINIEYEFIPESEVLYSNEGKTSKNQDSTSSLDDIRQQITTRI